ncbi:MAG: TldD/PmbA family protein, partial [Candidatus Eisenbacteria bacterium]|nr:TldD/PmbA family protein [Candidatus Eisenbacteria bacterium]
MCEMQQDFYDLADHLNTLLRPGEVHITTFRGEVSDFVRFNKSLLRQPGRVTQRYLSVDLVHGQRHAAGTVSLTGDPETDRAKTADLVERLRANLALVPEDPHLLYACLLYTSPSPRDSAVY